MIEIKPYRFFLSASLFFLLLIGLVQAGKAQIKQDTVEINRPDSSQIEQPLKIQTFPYFNYDRSTYKHLTTEGNRFNIPSRKKYYHSPATGQRSLNIAMKVFREQLENSITNSQFIRTLSHITSHIDIPFTISTLVFNKFIFFQNQPLPVIPPTNPYLYPQTKTGQAWRDFIENRHYSTKDGGDQNSRLRTPF